MPESMTVCERYGDACGAAIINDSFETHVRLNMLVRMLSCPCTHMLLHACNNRHSPAHSLTSHTPSAA